MAAIVPTDPYSIFMRKIGYSVGLERTFERIAELEGVYLKDRDITIGSWRELVKGETKWGLKNLAISDVFSSLRYIVDTSSDLLVLENLDASSIAVSMCEENLKCARRAREFIFLIAVIQNDGELFLNFLASNFEEDKIKRSLSDLISYKRKILFDRLPGKEARKKILHVVNIEHQQTNKGSAGEGDTVQSLIRTRPLSEEISRRDAPDRETISFSSDYFRKVPPKRRGWAKSLGLWSDEGGLTLKGQKFLKSLTSAGWQEADGSFVIWPLDYELVRSSFRPNLLPNILSFWGFVEILAKAFGDVQIKPEEARDTDDMVALISDTLRRYRRLHTRKAMLRRELPLTVAYPVAAALAYAKGSELINLPEALKNEQHGDQRRIAIRRSRSSGGALSVKR